MNVVALLLALAGATEAPRPDAPAVVQGADDSDGVPGVVATFAVAASADRVLEMLWSGRQGARIFAQVKRSTLIERTPDSTLTEVEVKAPIGSFVYRSRARLTRAPEGGGAIRWQRESGDFDVVRGAWIVTHVSATLCLVRYESWVAMGPRVLYGVVRDQALENSRTLAERVREALAADGGPARPAPQQGDVTPPARPAAPAPAPR